MKNLRISIAILLMLSATSWAADETPTAKEAAAPLIDFADWCAKNEAQSVGIKVLGEAIEIAPDADRIAEVGKALSGAGDAGKNAQVTSKLRDAEQSAAGEIDAFLIAHADDAEGLKRLYVAAITLDEKAGESLKPFEAKLIEKKLAGPWALPVVERLIDQHRQDLAGVYMVRLAAQDAAGFAAGDYAGTSARLGESYFILHAKSHPMVAIVSVPAKWNPAHKTPVIFCCEGAGNNFRHVVDLYHSSVNNGPYILVTPVTFSNTNEVAVAKYQEFYPADVVEPFVGKEDEVEKRLPFDLAGIIAMVQTVHEDFNTEDQIYISGFSGGGIPCYGLLLARPDLIAAAAPVCANFVMMKVGNAKAPGTLVQQFFGEKDENNKMIENEPGLVQQGAAAVPLLKDMGYSVLPVIMMPGKEHDPGVDEVHAFFKKVRDEKQKNAGK